MVLQLTWLHTSDIAFEIRAESAPVILGRGYGAELTVNDSLLSRQHCRFEFQGDEFFVRDLDSTNGTILNGATITEASLEDGDILLLGDAEFVVRCVSVPELEPASHA